ncbi:hypothetical protein J3Q64DRAFT_1730287, partial [Phycomyces blakesleeanus]
MHTHTYILNLFYFILFLLLFLWKHYPYLILSFLSCNIQLSSFSPIFSLLW